MSFPARSKVFSRHAKDKVPMLRELREKIANPKRFDTFGLLVDAVAVSMPDEYPSGMAVAFADDMVKSGKAVIGPEREIATGGTVIPSMEEWAKERGII